MRQFEIYLEMYCLDPYNVIGQFMKNVAFFCSQLKGPVEKGHK